MLRRLLHSSREFSLMDMTAAIVALGALAGEPRLALFRLLVQAGNDGLPAGAIAEKHTDAGTTRPVLAALRRVRLAARAGPSRPFRRS